ALPISVPIGIDRDASSSRPMLIVTDTRNAIVQDTLRKPSTNRSAVVKPTSKRPPMISQNQGMNFLSLDDGHCRINLRGHGEATHRRQHDCPWAFPLFSGGRRCRGANSLPLPEDRATDGNGGV